MLGVLNEYVHLASHVHARQGGPPDLAWLEDRLAQTPMGPLQKRNGFPDRELAALAAGSTKSTPASCWQSVGRLPSG